MAILKLNIVWRMAISLVVNFFWSWGWDIEYVAINKSFVELTLASRNAV